jgi:hypothetical protein
MTWRVILRVGLTKDKGSIVRNTALEPSFKAMGLGNTTTGTWEATHVEEASAIEHLHKVLKTLADPASCSSAPADVRFKHLWVYIDNESSTEPLSDDDDNS